MPKFTTTSGKTIGVQPGLVLYAEPGAGGLTTMLHCPQLGISFEVNGLVDDIWGQIEPKTQRGVVA